MVLSNLSYIIKQKVVTAVLLLMMFLGQSLLPAAMACHTSGQASSGDHVMMMMPDSNMDHSTHTMVADNDTQNTMAGKCCGDDCSCPAGSCSAMALVGLTALNKFQPPSQKINPLPARLIIQTPNLPFRPPIFG